MSIKSLNHLDHDEVLLGAIFANWCPYCVHMKPGFMEVTAGIPNIKTAIITHDRDDATMKTYTDDLNHLNTVILKDSKNKVAAQGYPTVFIIKNGNKIMYDGPSDLREESNRVTFKNWISKYSSQSRPRPRPHLRKSHTHTHSRPARFSLRKTYRNTHLQKGGFVWLLHKDTNKKITKTKSKSKSKSHHKKTK
jgi:hypothetical protein